MAESKPPVVCTFESRRASEMQSLVARFGGTVVSAPSMKEVPLEQNSEALAAIKQIVNNRVDAMILLTGVGTDAMVSIAESCALRAELLRTMEGIPLLVRGPKPAAALKNLGLAYTLKAPEPNTWHELVAEIDNAGFVVDGRTLAVQEYGTANPDLYAALTERGATVVPVPVYRWTLPDDVEPLKDAIRQITAGTIDVLLFTSAQQVRHVLQIAEQLNCQTEWKAAANNCFVSSIGPTCTDALREVGLDVNFEASPPKMGPLVRGAIEQWRTR